MANITDDKVVKLLKSHPDQSMQFYADKLGVPLGAVGSYVYRLEPVAKPSLKFQASKAAVVKARKEGMRWERIAARTGKSVAEVKRIGGKEADIYTGRGRDFSGAPRKASGNGGSGRSNSGGGKGTSGRRQAASNKASGNKPGRRGGGRARTRAEALARSGDPK